MMKYWLLLMVILASLIFIMSCGALPATTNPSNTDITTPTLTPTQTATPTHYISHTTTATPTARPTSNYTPSEAINDMLRETAQAFGRDIPIPTYLPQGYVISDAQFIQKQYSYDHVVLTLTATGKTDIIMQITWYIGPFRILPSSDNFASLSITGGSGTYSQWAMLNYHNDHNDLWWDWIPGTFPSNSTGAPAYYEMVLSASTEVPDVELVNIARFVRIP